MHHGMFGRCHDRLWSSIKDRLRRVIGEKPNDLRCRDTAVWWEIGEGVGRQSQTEVFLF